MNWSRFTTIGAWGAVILFAGLLMGCTGNVEEDATVQAVVEQLVSTHTPTATLPPTSTPTETAVPPTNTPTSEPTDTPVPPTPTATPVPWFAIEDQNGDAIVCDTQAASDDSEVDIVGIRADVQADSLLMRILMKSPLQNDYSFAVLVALSSNQEIAAYLWEIHEEELRVGEMDYQTGELLSGSGGVVIEHDQALGELTFSIPHSTTVTISSTNTLSQTVASRALWVSSFHTPRAGEAKNCDTVGPLTLPDLPSSP